MNHTNQIASDFKNTRTLGGLDQFTALGYDLPALKSHFALAPEGDSLPGKVKANLKVMNDYYDECLAPYERLGSSSSVSDEAFGKALKYTQDKGCTMKRHNEVRVAFQDNTRDLASLPGQCEQDNKVENCVSELKAKVNDVSSICKAESIIAQNCCSGNKDACGVSKDDTSKIKDLCIDSGQSCQRKCDDKIEKFEADFKECFYLSRMDAENYRLHQNDIIEMKASVGFSQEGLIKNPCLEDLEEIRASFNNQLENFKINKASSLSDFTSDYLEDISVKTCIEPAEKIAGVDIPEVEKDEDEDEDVASNEDEEDKDKKEDSSSLDLSGLTDAVASFNKGNDSSDTGGGSSPPLNSIEQSMANIEEARALLNPEEQLTERGQEQMKGRDISNSEEGEGEGEEEDVAKNESEGDKNEKDEDAKKLGGTKNIDMDKLALKLQACKAKPDLCKETELKEDYEAMYPMRTIASDGTVIGKVSEEAVEEQIALARTPAFLRPARRAWNYVNRARRQIMGEEIPKPLPVDLTDRKPFRPEDFHLYDEDTNLFEEHRTLLLQLCTYEFPCQ